MAYYKLEPFGPLHSDEQFGVLCSLVANMLRKGEQSAAFPEDFFSSLDPRTDAEKQSDAAELLAKQAHYAMMMARVGRKAKDG